MSSDARAYYLERGRAELAAAQNAQGREAAMAHLQLSDHYFARVAEIDLEENLGTEGLRRRERDQGASIDDQKRKTGRIRAV